MPKIPVQFTYLTGLRRDIFRNARLMGSWDQNGRYSNQWSSLQMQQATGEDGSRISHKLNSRPNLEHESKRFFLINKISDISTQLEA